MPRAPLSFPFPSVSPPLLLPFCLWSPSLRGWAAWLAGVEELAGLELSGYSFGAVDDEAAPLTGAAVVNPRSCSRSLPFLENLQR